jgi:hypothetical protein
MARSLRVLQVSLGVLGTMSAFAVTTFAGELGTLLVKLCSFIAALSIGILTAFDIGGKANATRHAHRLLSLAVLRYLYLPASSPDNLLDSYAQAQEIVGGVTYRHVDGSGAEKV